VYTSDREEGYGVHVATRSISAGEQILSNYLKGTTLYYRSDDDHPFIVLTETKFRTLMMIILLLFLQKQNLELFATALCCCQPVHSHAY
jgi:hypothetical protein